MLHRPSTLNPSFPRLPGRSFPRLSMVYHRLRHFIYTASLHYDVFDILEQAVGGTVSRCENAVTGLPQKAQNVPKLSLSPQSPLCTLSPVVVLIPLLRLEYETLLGSYQCNLTNFDEIDMIRILYDEKLLRKRYVVKKRRTLSSSFITSCNRIR